MIGSLRGSVLSIEQDEVIIEVGGVGYLVHMPLNEVGQLRENQDVFAYTVLTLSQDAVNLYAFLSKSSKRMFAQLQKVPGVGPKAALALLSALAPAQLLAAIQNQDVTALTKAPGIGKKGAQKIILELSGSIAQVADDKTVRPEATSLFGPYLQEVVDGLVSLGWQSRDAIGVVKRLAEQQGLDDRDIAESEVPTFLRSALVNLDRGK